MKIFKKGLSTFLIVLCLVFVFASSSYYNAPRCQDTKFIL
jgi:CHASE3 domain sensor protein